MTAGLLLVGIGLIGLDAGARQERSRGRLRPEARGRAGAFLQTLHGRWRDWRRRPDPRTERELWPALIQQMAALLKSGLDSASLWQEMARAGTGREQRGNVAADIAVVLTVAADRAALGLDALHGLPVGELRHPMSRRIVHELGACWSVAAETGAPLATVLERFAAAVEDDLDARAARETALAGPRATARILSGLPLLGLGLGMAMGTDPVGVLLGQVWGHLALGAGAVLALAGAWWSRRLVAAATQGGAT